jgi:signal recognition particle subunit SEC65
MSSFILGPCQCGQPLKFGRHFCSLTCKGLALRRRVMKTCPSCQRVFETGGRISYKSPSLVKFCSVACQRQSRYRRGAQAHRISDDTVRYLAGFFDGEGTVTAYLSQEGRPKGRVVRIRLSIANTVRGPLDEFCAESGVGVVMVRQKKNPRHKPLYTWLVSAEAAESVFRQMRPFLKIKRAQADLAIRIQEDLRDPEKKADRSWQEQVVLQMQTLNGYEGRLRLVVSRPS